jgi:hypothetical protein
MTSCRPTRATARNAQSETDRGEAVEATAVVVATEVIK